MIDKLHTKTGHVAIIHVTQGGDVVADELGGFTPGFPFILKNDGSIDAELEVRLADQVSGEAFSLKLLANSRYSDELLAEILSGIPETHGLRWGG